MATKGLTEITNQTNDNQDDAAFFDQFSLKTDGFTWTDPPVFIKGNGQEGKFYIGDLPLGEKLQIIPLNYSEWFGDLGMTSQQTWGQLWFVPVGSDCPVSGTVCVMYIKTGSLSEWRKKRQLWEITNKKLYQFAIVDCKFEKQSFQRLNPENGASQTINYYTIKFDFQNLDSNVEEVKRLKAEIKEKGVSQNGLPELYSSHLYNDSVSTMSMVPLTLKNAAPVNNEQKQNQQQQQQPAIAPALKTEQQEENDEIDEPIF